MEFNEISMFLDVKLDLKEKNELLNLRSWTKCYVKIEAIKCFPCYIKITILRHIHDTAANAVTRINLPGLHAQMASSRTKNFAYGLFWKNNRKKCTAFFGFDLLEHCEKHMKWVNMSINNLELHRQEILQSRRLIRDQPSTIEENRYENTCENTRLAATLEESKVAKDVNDVLGPLPNVPVTDANWSRRISGMSGIYEEIFCDRNSIMRPSRVSVASGIYEEMKPLPEMTPENTSYAKESLQVRSLPPPLPPRVRANTLECEIPRSYTNPETLKKNKISFKSVFRSRSASKSDKKSPVQKEEIVLRHNRFKPRAVFLENKRNSYSSPDLTKFNYCPDDSFDEFSFESQHSSTGSDHASSLLNESCYDSPKPVNISHNIGSNFNSSCLESSTINLVGANVASQDTHMKRELSEEKVVMRKKSLDNEVGYIVMNRPINKPKLTPHVTVERCFDIQFRFDDIVPSDATIVSTKSTGVYQNMNINNDENNYVDMTSSKSTINTDANYDSPKRLMEESTNAAQSKSNRNSVDEKIPSYYPNSYKIKENVYITTPKLVAITRRTSSSEKSKSPTPSPPKLIIEKKKSLPTKSPSTQNITTHSPFAQRIYQKYATLALSRTLKGSPKSLDKIEVTKKFSTLPRFRRIDFSPLKMKINSVLNRHNAEF